MIDMALDYVLSSAFSNLLSRQGKSVLCSVMIESQNTKTNKSTSEVSTYPGEYSVPWVEFATL